MITAQTIITVVILYLVIINVVGYVIMGVDKKRAIRGAWRISEASLFFTALLFGWQSGMYSGNAALPS